MTNAPDEEALTPEEAEEPNQPTDSQQDGEPQPTEGEESSEVKIEPPAGTKSWEHALQQAREREKKIARERDFVKEQLTQVNSRLEELEVQGLDETEKLKFEADKARKEAEELREQIRVESAKKEYRSILAQKETEYPKTIAFLRKQADRDLYPVQGSSMEEFEANLAELAADFEGATGEAGKASASNPAYVPPQEPDYDKLSSNDMRKLLPLAEK